jgi:hypothetical protein
MGLTASHAWVAAAPFAAHLRLLLSLPDVSLEVVALLAGVAPRVIRRILTGDGQRPLRRLSPDTASRLYAITPELLHRCHERRVPASATAATMRQLSAAGWSVSDWSRVLGLRQAAVAELMSGRTCTCTYWTALQVRAAAVAVRSRLGSARLASVPCPSAPDREPQAA